MSTVQQVLRYFSVAATTKGEAYFRQGRVHIATSDETGIEARVSGSERRPYKVDLEWGERASEAFVECTCPHYEEGNFCKHIAATFFAADSAGLLPPWHGDWEMVHRDDDDESWDPEVRVVRLSSQSPHSRTTKSNGATSGPRWHEELAAFSPSQLAHYDGADSSTLDGRKTRALFIIDIALSVAANAIVINLFQQSQNKNGQWGKIKALHLRRSEVVQFDEQDRHALELLVDGFTGDRSNGYASRPAYYMDYERIAQVQLALAMHEVVLPVLCATGRLGWSLNGVAEPKLEILTWDADAPWEFRLSCDRSGSAKAWKLRGALHRGDEVRLMSEPILVVPSGWVVFRNSLARFVPPRDRRWVMMTRARSEVVVPCKERASLLNELWVGGEPLDASLPAELRLAPTNVAPRGVLQVHALPDAKKMPLYHRDDWFYASVLFDYADHTVALDDVRKAAIDGEAGRAYPRDADAETALVARLAELGVRPKQRLFYYDAPGHVQIRRTQLECVIARLAGEGWRVEAEGAAVRKPGQFQVSVSSGIDWFDLDAHIDFDGVAVGLPKLLAALQAKSRFITLDDGSQGLLPEEWIARFAPLADLATVEGDRLRFRPSQALLLDVLLSDRESAIELSVDRAFAARRKKLQSFAGIKPRKAPPGFRGELRPYQQQGLGWLAFLADFELGGCLADDMGLGKTVQVLAWLAARRRRGGDKLGPTLIVAPKSLVVNWQLEAAKFTPKLTVVNYTGLTRRQVVEEVAAADLVLTTYGTLRQDVELLKDVEFDYVILDEAQAIKNEKSVSAKACRLLQAKHRLALTGTPVENSLDDLWSIFEFLNPGMLGRSSGLKALTTARDASQDDGERERQFDALRRGLAPFILRRTKDQVLTELPKKTEQTLHVDLLPADRKRYDELRRHYRDSLLKKVADQGMNRARMHVLEALLRLRQTACHAGLVDKKLIGAPSAKVEVLHEQIEEIAAEGHKAIVFSQFTSLLAIVRKELDKRKVTYEYLDGKTRDRQSRVERFQTDPACPLFLISLKAGGVGLNLTAADYVYLLDPWWNPAVEAQAIDRAHRIGQERPVFAYRLVARDTVEEKIIELQQRKRAIADAIISEDRRILSGLTADDLQMLLS